MNMNSVPDITLKALKHQIKMVIKQMSLFQQDDINKAITFLQQCILKNLKSNGLTMIPIFFNNKHYDFMKSSSKSTRFGAKYYMDMKTKGVLRVVNMPQFRSIIVHYKHKKLGFKTKYLKEIKYFKHIKTSRESEKENNYYNPQSNSSLIETNTYETELLVNEDTDDNYSDTSDLSSGLSINHDGGYKCSKCDLVFMQKQQLGIHLKNHNKYKCLDCPMTFSNQKLALKHKKQSSNKNSDPDASVHNIEGLEKSTLKCFICPRTFYRVKKLKNHMQAHAVNNLLSCPVCKASYKTRNILELHIKSHKNTLECNLNEINDISEEKNENITDVIQENLSLICDLCGKIFTKRTSLTQHKKRSHGEARYSCELCDFSSKSSFNLRRHLISHTSERPIICDQCGMAFRNASALKEHILYAHNKDCQHQCEMCPKKFKVKSALSRHLQSCHSDERPYACQWCKQAYKRSSHLRRHELQRHGDLKTKNPQTLNDLKKNDEEENIQMETQQEYIDKRFHNEVYMNMQWNSDITSGEIDKAQFDDKLHPNGQNTIINLIDAETSQIVEMSTKEQAMKQIVSDLNGDYMQSNEITYQGLWPNKQQMDAMNITSSNCLKYVDETMSKTYVDKYVTIDLNGPSNHQVIYLENNDTSKIADIPHAFPDNSGVNSMHVNMNQGMHQNLQNFSQECDNAMIMDHTGLQCALAEDLCKSVNNEHNDSLSVLSSLSDYIHTPFSYV